MKKHLWLFLFLGIFAISSVFVFGKGAWDRYKGEHEVVLLTEEEALDIGYQKVDKFMQIVESSISSQEETLLVEGISSSCNLVDTKKFTNVLTNDLIDAILSNAITSNSHYYVCNRNTFLQDLQSNTIFGYEGKARDYLKVNTILENEIFYSYSLPNETRVFKLVKEENEWKISQYL